jgi:hypothetical protein
MQHIFQYVPGINRLGGEDEHPSLSSAEDKKKLSSKSTSSVCDQDKFILYFISNKKNTSNDHLTTGRIIGILGTPRGS